MFSTQQLALRNQVAEIRSLLPEFAEEDRPEILEHIQGLVAQYEYTFPEEIWTLIKDYAIGKSKKDIFKRILGNAFDFPETQFVRNVITGSCITNDFRVIQDGQSLQPYTSGLYTAGMIFLSVGQYGPRFLIRINKDLTWGYAYYSDIYKEDTYHRTLNYSENDIHYLYFKEKNVLRGKKLIFRKNVGSCRTEIYKLFRFDATKPFTFEVYRQLAEGQRWEEMYNQGRR
jgi:hypothetical protein